MEKKKRIIKLAAPPVTVPITKIKEKLFPDIEEVLERVNRYTQYRSLVELDAELFSTINACALLIASAIRGFTVKYGQELDKQEQQLYEELKWLFEELRTYLYDIAFKVLLYGDAIYVKEMVTKQGFDGLTYLPIEYVTVRSTSNSNEPEDEPIQEAKWYFFNEGMTKEKKWPADQIVHFNWGRKELVKDNFNRLTLGIFTLPPLESLKYLLLWKFSILLSDMAWRSVNFPREHHKLPSEPFNPDYFAGSTQEERVQAAKAAARAAMEEYRTNLQRHKADRALITLDDVEVEIIEPKLKYTDPNELLMQIKQTIAETYGVPASAIPAAAYRGTFAAEVKIASFFFEKVKHLARLIGRKLIEIAISHLETKYGKKYEKYYKEIGVSIFFESELLEKARAAALLAEIGIFAPEEIRAMLGFSPQMPEVVVARQKEKPHSRTTAQVAVAEVRTTKPQAPLTPHSETDKQKV